MGEDTKPKNRIMILSILKKDKWNTLVIATTITLLIVGWLHSLQSAENYVDGFLLDMVTLLLMLVVAMNVISLILLAVHLVRDNWSRFFVILAVMVISISLWVITLIYIDSSIAFIT